MEQWLLTVHRTDVCMKVHAHAHAHTSTTTVAYKWMCDVCAWCMPSASARPDSKPQHKAPLTLTLHAPTSRLPFTVIHQNPRQYLATTTTGEGRGESNAVRGGGNPFKAMTTETATATAKFLGRSRKREVVNNVQQQADPDPKECYEAGHGGVSCGCAAPPAGATGPAGSAHENDDREDADQQPSHHKSNGGKGQGNHYLTKTQPGHHLHMLSRCK
jgi:hypothetical protein